jgi:SAM-dependent methyltransferase
VRVKLANAPLRKGFDFVRDALIDARQQCRMAQTHVARASSAQFASLVRIAIAAAGCTACCTASLAMQPTQPSPVQPSLMQPASIGTPVVDALAKDAASLKALTEHALSHTFLAAVTQLPEPTERTMMRSADRTLAYSPEQAMSLSPEVAAKLKAKVYEPSFFYSTGYGSPLVYVRLLDLAAEQQDMSLENLRVMDFGFGALGHLRTLAYAGATAHGVDVEPVLGALYSQPGDTGVVQRSANNENAPQGAAFVHIGRWPAEKAITSAIAEAARAEGAEGFDLVTSKNTLKAGYIHPSPPAGKTVDEKQTIKLGVDDETFLREVHAVLKPGGLFVIYNICPPQSDANDASAPYIPWADGKSPFSREQFAAAGFEVLVMDADDTAWTLQAFEALGYKGEATDEEFRKQYVTWYTVLRRAEKPAPIEATPAK